jgi:hypothetical protein
MLVFFHDRQSLVYNAYLSQICVQYSTVKRFFYYMGDLSQVFLYSPISHQQYTLQYCRSVIHIMYVADLSQIYCTSICDLFPIFYRYFCIRRSLTYSILPICNLHCVVVVDLSHKKYMRSLSELSQVFLYSPISLLQFTVIPICHLNNVANLPQTFRICDVSPIFHR